MTKQGKKVFVGLSGGVDSSVAAFLLKKQGYEVTGVFLKCFNLDGCAERDAEDARRVAEHLDIPFYVFDFEEEYKCAVVEEMVKGYREGITPNPDVLCNREIKFGLFLKKALALGADYVATGHYVRLRRKFSIFNFQFSKLFKKIVNSNIENSLEIASDKNKDQSYFLYTLNQEDLKHCLFPLGNYKKPQVRKIAEKAGLSTAKKKDSQGICFLGQVNLEEFLKTYIPEKPGDIVTLNGQVIGQHKGSHFYTVGQRHGLDLKDKGKYLKRGSEATQPFYVAAKDLEKNLVIVAEGDENEALYKKEVNLVQVNFITSNHKLFAIGHTPVFARVRYRQPLQKAEFSKTEKGWRLVFKEPVKFVAEGQSAVFYDRRGHMLGGGVIV
jgi:tRNA-specific 2-thiouridylase